MSQVPNRCSDTSSLASERAIKRGAGDGSSSSRSLRSCAALLLVVRCKRDAASWRRARSHGWLSQDRGRRLSLSDPPNGDVTRRRRGSGGATPWASASRRTLAGHGDHDVLETIDKLKHGTTDEHPAKEVELDALLTAPGLTAPETTPATHPGHRAATRRAPDRPPPPPARSGGRTAGSSNTVGSRVSAPPACGPISGIA